MGGDFGEDARLGAAIGRSPRSDAVQDAVDRIEQRPARVAQTRRTWLKMVTFLNWNETEKKNTTVGRFGAHHDVGIVEVSDEEEEKAYRRPLASALAVAQDRQVDLVQLRRQAGRVVALHRYRGLRSS